MLLKSRQSLLCPRAPTWSRRTRGGGWGELPAHRSPLTTHAASPHIQLAGGAGHEGEGGYEPVVVLLGDLLLAASQSVTAAAQRGRDVGDGGIQLQPEKTIWQ